MIRHISVKRNTYEVVINVTDWGKNDKVEETNEYSCTATDDLEDIIFDNDSEIPVDRLIWLKALVREFCA